MNFTNEQINKAKQAKTVEELLAIAKENGVELTEEQAKEYFAELHKEGELSDEELEAVAGGKDPDPKFQVGDRVVICAQWSSTGREVEWTIYVVNKINNFANGQWHYYIVAEGETYGFEWSEDGLMRIG